MDPNDIATKEDISRLRETINQLFEEIAKLKPAVKNRHEEIYLTSKEVMEIYKMKKTHLTNLRNKRLIPYSKPFGVTLYPKSEIEMLIKNNYIK